MHRYVSFLGLACLAAAVAILVTPKPLAAKPSQTRDNNPEPREPAPRASRLGRMLVPHFHASFSVN